MEWGFVYVNQGASLDEQERRRNLDTRWFSKYTIISTVVQSLVEDDGDVG